MNTRRFAVSYHYLSVALPPLNHPLALGQHHPSPVRLRSAIMASASPYAVRAIISGAVRSPPVPQIPVSLATFADRI